MWLRMSDQIAARMTATLEAGMNQILTNMSRMCDTTAQAMSHDQVEGVRRITHQFIQQMNVSLGGQLSTLGTAMREAAQCQQAVNQQLLNAMNEVQQATEHAMQITRQNTEMILQLQSLCTQLDDQQTRRSQMLLTANEAGRQMTDSIVELNDSLQRMKHMLDQTAEHVQQLAQNEQEMP